MRILDLALKDIRQVFRDRKSALFLMVMPVVFTLFFGFAFGGSAQEGDARLNIGIVNQDADGVLSTVLLDQLNASETVRPEVINAADAAQLDSLVVKGDLAAALIIPEQFSTATLAGEDPRMELIINEESDNGQTARRALQTAITRTMGMAETARLGLQAYETRSGALDAAAREDFTTEVVRRAAQSWEAATVSVKVTKGTASSDPMGGNIYNQFSPGMMVMFAIFGLNQAAMVMVVERRTRAMARLLTTPMRKAELIGGHILGMFILFFAQQLLLVLFGQIVLKVNYFREPAAVLLIIAALSLWVASLGLLISALVKKEDQVILYGMMAMFVFSALGGSWFSLEMVGETFAAIGHLTPTAWAIDGIRNIIVRGLGLQSVLLPVGVILAYSGAFFGLAIWRFKFE